MILSPALAAGLQEGSLIPLVGGGVSRMQYPAPAVLPALAVKKLVRLGRTREARFVRNLLGGTDAPDLDYALREARGYLGTDWTAFLQEIYAPSSTVASSLARCLWELGSRLVATVTPDPLLSHSCPPPAAPPDLWSLLPPIRGGKVQKRSIAVGRKTLWHLHGHGGAPEALILVPDGAHAFPADARPRREAAWAALRAGLADQGKGLLLVGFSLNDPRFGPHLAGLAAWIRETRGEHVALVTEREGPGVEKLADNLAVATYPGGDEGLEAVLTRLGGVAEIGRAAREAQGVEEEPPPEEKSPSVVDRLGNVVDLLIQKKRAMGAFDLLIVHNDRAEATRVARALMKRGIYPWLDVWNRPHGAALGPILQPALEKVEGALVLVGGDAVPPWKGSLWNNPLKELHGRGVPVYPVRLPTCPEEPPLPDYLAEVAWSVLDGTEENLNHLVHRVIPPDDNQ